MMFIGNAISQARHAPFEICLYVIDKDPSCFFSTFAIQLNQVIELKISGQNIVEMKVIPL